MIICLKNREILKCIQGGLALIEAVAWQSVAQFFNASQGLASIPQT